MVEHTTLKVGSHITTMSISEEDKKKYLEELAGEITKNVVVYQFYESFYQGREAGKNSADDLTRLGNIQRELKNNEDILEHLQLIKKVK
jgi:hypothetical protein